MRSSTLRRLLRPAALLLALAGFLGAPAAAQTVTHSGRTCGTHTPTTHEVLETVVVAEQWLAANADRVARFRSGGEAVTIPVAFHIISSGPSPAQGNVPDQWVTDQMDVLNAAFEPMGFQFVLAFQQRVQNADWASLTDNSPEEVAMKQTLHLDPARFLNIYSVPDLGQLLGWATFPRAGAETDPMQGVVLLTSSMPGGNGAPYNLGDTGTHEVGHYVGLFHTFQGGCAGGDGVDDTPAVATANFGCPTGRDSCPSDGLGPDQVENFMDYTDDACMDRFTPGQGERALALMSQFRPTIMSQSGAFLSASTLAFGQVSVGTPATRTLQVVNLSDAALGITSIASDNALFTPSVAAGSIPAGAALAVEVTFDPTGAGTATGTLSVVTADGDIGTLTVALSGTGVLSPAVSIPTPAVAAASAVDGEATATLGIDNEGGGVLFYTFGGFARAGNAGGAAQPDATRAAPPVKGAIDLARGAGGSLDGGGPDGFGYEWADSNEPGGPAYSWVDIASTGTAVSLGDDASATVPLPFAFPFYGADQNSVRIVSNGFLAFGGASTAFTNAAIPSGADPNNLIAVYWDDLDPSSGGSVRYQDMGDGRFVVSWIDVPHYAQAGARGSFTFQAILHQDGSIVTQYQAIEAVSTDANSATIGIENADGSDGLQVVFNAPYIENELAIRFATGAQWIASVTPATGIVAPNGSTSVTVGLSAAGLEAGAYQDLLQMSTNDPARPLVPFHVVYAVGDDVLPMPALTAPYFGSESVNPSATFTWLAVDGATGYEVEVATDDAFANVVFQGSPAGTEAGADLQPLTDYLWRARTTTAAATSDWTLAFPFRTGVVVAAGDGAPERADGVALGTFFPNPTRGLVTVPFALAEAQAGVQLRVLDVTGRLVATLVDGALGAGAHQVTWQSADQPAGIYLVQLRANGQVETGRVVVLR